MSSQHIMEERRASRKDNFVCLDLAVTANQGHIKKLLLTSEAVDTFADACKVAGPLQVVGIS